PERPVRFLPVDLGVLTCKRESETSVHAVTPVRSGDGHVEVLELSTREVTPIIDEFKKLEAQEG
ncbi:MAG TPA: hypothetical protein VGI66_08115, partial [Streptosporangiaceae bacterium]